MRVSPLVFDREFSRFKTQIRQRSNGREFTSFHEGVAADGESYKEHVRNEALHRLQLPTWKTTDIGTGKILKRVIDAVEINEHPRHLRNNLVAWPNKYGHTGRSHSALLDAQTDAPARRKFEQWFFDLFRNERDEEVLFESFRELAGSRYDLVAYFFFLKDWTRFMPIATSTFDKAFQLLEVDLVTKQHCSWENYRQFNDALLAVQRRLIDVGELSDARLIDAHSFCWILVRLDVLPPRLVTIPLPELLTGVIPVTATEEAKKAQTEFNELDDEWFSRRDANRRRIGKLAQEVALLSERARLREGRHPNADAAVQPVWTQPGRGYDILSQEVDQTPRHIEVKAARRSAEKVMFFVSTNEWNTAQSLSNYWFYFVFDVESEQPRVQILESTNVPKECLAPTNYLAALTIPKA
jgi:uncharacterized protein DUF3883